MGCSRVLNRRPWNSPKRKGSAATRDGALSPGYYSFLLSFLSWHGVAVCIGKHLTALVISCCLLHLAFYRSNASFERARFVHEA